MFSRLGGLRGFSIVRAKWVSKLRFSRSADRLVAFRV